MKTIEERWETIKDKQSKEDKDNQIEKKIAYLKRILKISDFIFIILD